MIEYEKKNVGDNMKPETKGKLKVTTAMIIYGTIGLFVKNISLPSASISMARGLIGAPFLLIVLLLKKQKLDLAAIKLNFRYLFVSGALLGINWILLFESYNYTTVAAATLCYNMAPVIIILLSPLLFGEKLTLRKLLCIAAAMVGMLFVSGMYSGSFSFSAEKKGLLLALGAAFLYAMIVIFNKKSGYVPPFDRTIFQLLLSAFVLLPYCLLQGKQLVPTGLKEFLLLAVLGIVHTGLAYLLYFGSMEFVPSQSLAILSYVDPVVAVLISAFILGETVGRGELVGAVLIIGSALVSELPEHQSVRK